MFGLMLYYTCAFAFVAFPIQSNMVSVYVVKPIYIVAFDEANNLFEKVVSHSPFGNSSDMYAHIVAL